MVRAVTFWYTKELSSFENNEDLDAPKIDVTRYQDKEVEKFIIRNLSLKELKVK